MQRQRQQQLWLNVFIAANSLALALTAFTFYNIDCKSHDKAYSEFEYCYIKAINRSYKYISMKLKLHQLPVTNAQVNVVLYKRDQGWKPVFFNINFDGCQFLRSTNRNPFVSQVYNMIIGSTNMNHTCPYNHDVVIDHFSTSEAEAKWGSFFPLPVNDYRIGAKWYMDGIYRLEISVYIRVN